MGPLEVSIYVSLRVIYYLRVIYFMGIFLCGLLGSSLLILKDWLKDWFFIDIALMIKLSFFFIIGLINDFVNADDTIDFFYLSLFVIYLVISCN